MLNFNFQRFVDLFAYILSVLLTLSYALCEKVLNLSVYGAKIVLCPCCDFFKQLCRNAERHLFFFRQRLTSSFLLQLYYVSFSRFHQ